MGIQPQTLLAEVYPKFLHLWIWMSLLFSSNPNLAHQAMIYHQNNPPHPNLLILKRRFFSDILVMSLDQKLEHQPIFMELMSLSRYYSLEKSDLRHVPLFLMHLGLTFPFQDHRSIQNIWCLLPLRTNSNPSYSLQGKMAIDPCRQWYVDPRIIHEFQTSPNTFFPML